MVVATITAAVYADNATWPLILASGAVVAGLLPHVALLMRPPLGQLPGLSVMVNYALCFAHRYVLITLLFLAYAVYVSGWGALQTMEAVVAFEALIIHLFNWNRYQRISATTAANVNRLIGKVTKPGQQPVISCDDATDELGQLQRSWKSLFVFGPLVFALAQLFPPKDLRFHRNIKYLERGQDGEPNDPACYLDVMYSADEATYKHFEQRPVAIYVHGGAWSFGSKVWNSGPTMRWLLARRGFIVVSVGYRFAPRQPWPSHLRCLSQAMRFIRRSYGRHPAFSCLGTVDSSSSSPSSSSSGAGVTQCPPMVLIGASAGAHISLTFSLVQALLRCGAQDQVHPEILEPVAAALAEDAVPAGLVACYPPTDMTDKLGSYLKFPCNLPRFLGAPVGPTKGQSMFAWFFHRLVSRRSDENQSFMRSSCPLELLAALQAHATENPANAAAVANSLVPILTIHCDGDGVVPIGSSVEFMKQLAALRTFSVDTDTPDFFLDVPSVGHSFDILLSHLGANAARATYAWSTSLVPQPER